jgi:hypothetical protein
MTILRRRPQHRCAAFGCRKSVNYNFLMCSRHWALVPRPLQVAVYETWNDGKRTRGWAAAVSAAVSSISTQGDMFAELREFPSGRPPQGAA